MKKILSGIIALLCSSILPAQTESPGKISGLMFVDYFYNAARDASFDSLSNTAISGRKDMHGFKFRRIYFTYDYKISTTFKTRFRLEADQSDITSNNKIGVFVKDAYISWNNIFSGSNLILGIQPTPAFQVAESFWGYRSLEKTILDLRGIVSSRDLAVSLQGKIIGKNFLNYWVMFGNGNGNSPEIDKYKRYYAHVNLNPTENFSITFYSDFKSRSPIVTPISRTILSNNEITFDFFTGYRERDKFSFGGEIFLTIRANGNLRRIQNGSEYFERIFFGVSIFGSYEFSPLIGILGRYDFFDPNINTDHSGDSRNFFILGLSYNPDKKFSIIPNILLETYEKSSTGYTIDPSLTARVTLNYIFL